jgi:hypothetical protein
MNIIADTHSITFPHPLVARVPFERTGFARGALPRGSHLNASVEKLLD